MSAADPLNSSEISDSPSRSLPPVEAPTGSFILQLFLIPLVIVTMVVLLWLMFSWLAHMGRDNPQAIVQQLSRFDESSWQRAYELAELLRSPDGEREHAQEEENGIAAEVSAGHGRGRVSSFTHFGSCHHCGHFPRLPSGDAQ